MCDQHTSSSKDVVISQQQYGGALCCDMTVHVASCCILHGDCQILFREETFLKSHNMRVDQDGMVQDLPLNVLGYLSLCAGEVRLSTKTGAFGFDGKP